ncbi:hypothetical protein [Fundidesulfovibrio putealis]|uniref:hypothetical protein n=1 Tax=Fundidesulfovibrio putealis TaxID=270496 RepID=UPI0012EB5169|nr:hypothetical protein [Fundidesulfovibrio putealis]
MNASLKSSSSTHEVPGSGPDLPPTLDYVKTDTTLCVKFLFNHFNVFDLARLMVLMGRVGISDIAAPGFCPDTRVDSSVGGDEAS